LWLRGDFYALGLAVFYSILLNLALVSSLIWPAYLGSRFLVVAWPLLAVVWLASAWISWRGMPLWFQVGHKIAAPAEMRVDTLFNQAQREYLKGNWAEARELLERRLRLRPRDVESRLLLVSVLRRVGRFQAAVSEIELLEGMDEESSAQELRINEHQHSESMPHQAADDSELAGEDPAASPQRRAA
jgi:tetratricopeptide (TPR) repeat protein